MAVAVVDAIRLLQENRRVSEELSIRQEQLTRRTVAETEAQDKARTALYDEGLLPFQQLFSRLKNVDLSELEKIDALPVGGTRNVEVRGIRVSVVHTVGAVAGGAAAGAGAGAATFAAVGALATASTGTAISGLSGAAATSATLAWLGGGSLAAGGGGVAAGTTVLAGIVAAPAMIALGGVLEWQARRARRDQRETAEQLAEAAVSLGRAEKTGALARRRSRQVRDVLGDLRQALGLRLPELQALLEVNDDYSSFTAGQRQVVSSLVGIATSAVTVMSTRIVEEDGTASEACRQVVLDAKQRLLALPALR